VNGEDGRATNGAGAAAVLAAGIGSFVLGMGDVAADKLPGVKNLFNFYKPTGPLSGVTTVAIGAWLVAWMLLGRRWRDKDVPIGRTNAIAYVLLGLALLLTFPPFADLF
jgi:hypothetical protein